MSIEAKIKEAEEKLAKADADKASREAWLGGWCGTLVLLGRFGGLAKLVCFSPKNADSGSYGGVAKGGSCGGRFGVVEAQCCRLNSFS